MFFSAFPHQIFKPSFQFHIQNESYSCCLCAEKFRNKCFFTHAHELISLRVRGQVVDHRWERPGILEHPLPVDPVLELPDPVSTNSQLLAAGCDGGPVTHVDDPEKLGLRSIFRFESGVLFFYCLVSFPVFSKKNQFNKLIYRKKPLLIAGCMRASRGQLCANFFSRTPAFALLSRVSPGTLESDTLSGSWTAPFLPLPRTRRLSALGTCRWRSSPRRRKRLDV